MVAMATLLSGAAAATKYDSDWRLMETEICQFEELNVDKICAGVADDSNLNLEKSLS